MHLSAINAVTWSHFYQSVAAVSSPQSLSHSQYKSITTQI